MYKLHYLLNKFNHINSNSNSNLIENHDTWLEGRKHCIGGSDMFIILKGKTDEFNKLIQDKITKNNLQIDATNWGKMFEPVAKLILEQDLKIKIIEFDSIPHSYYPICYSPDGLFIQDNDLKLLEIKCPIMKSLNKPIQESYIDQVQTGMNIIPVKNCLFARYRFRRCALWCKPNSMEFDRFYHKEFKKRQIPVKPICYGYLIWKHQDENNKELIDLGIVESIIKIKPRGPPTEIIIINYDENLEKNKFKDFKPTSGYVLMWKLFEFKYDIIQPNLNFLKDNEIKIWEQYKILIDENNKKNKKL